MKDPSAPFTARIYEPDSKEAKACEMYYSSYFPYDEGLFSDWREFFDAWHDTHEEGNDRSVRPDAAFLTQNEKLKIYADDIIEEACADLYDEAELTISEADRKELQAFLDAWCAKQTGTTTYWPDFKHAVRIPWENDI